MGNIQNCCSKRLNYRPHLMMRITEFPVFMMVFHPQVINFIQIWIALKGNC